MIGYDTVFKPGYTLSFATAENRVGDHVFCGPHEVKLGSCPNCERQLLKLLSIDLRDRRMADLSSGDLARIDLMYCWTCALSQDVFCYRLKSSNEIDILKFKKGRTEPEFPYPNYPEFFPAKPIALEVIKAEDEVIQAMINEGRLNEQEVISKRPELCRPRNQIGGVPYLVQKNPGQSLICPACNTDMPFLASIVDDAENGLIFTGNDYVQVLYCYCRDCRVVAAFQQCD